MSLDDTLLGASAAALTVVICTRDRPTLLAQTLDALDAQAAAPALELIVVDQSVNGGIDPSVRVRYPLRVIADTGVGVSRARNIGLAHARADWVAFLDDDCPPHPDWARRLMLAMGEHPEVDLVGGPVEAPEWEYGDLRAVSLRRVRKSRLIRGPLTWPLGIGYGMNVALRRATAQRLGGWDERLGAGTRPFPAGEDVDFNVRFLRSGAVALASPHPRVVHLQWRRDDQLPALHHGYLAGSAACAVKQVQGGHWTCGMLLWVRLVARVAWMVAGALRRRSPLHWEVARAQAHGLWRGTTVAARRGW